jgi:hypothetical protein
MTKLFYIIFKDVYIYLISIIFQKYFSQIKKSFWDKTVYYDIKVIL